MTSGHLALCRMLDAGKLLVPVAVRPWIINYKAHILTWLQSMMPQEC